MFGEVSTNMGVVANYANYACLGGLWARERECSRVRGLKPELLIHQMACTLTIAEYIAFDKVDGCNFAFETDGTAMECFSRHLRIDRSLFFRWVVARRKLLSGLHEC